jgi:hypothetical protein
MTLLSIEDQRVAKVVSERDAMLERQLRDLGPGWAVGYRLKTVPPLPDPVRGWPAVKVEWELHCVELVDGKLEAGLAGFSYVTLKE